MKARKRLIKQLSVSLTLIIAMAFVMEGCGTRTTDSSKLFHENIQAFQLVADYLNDHKCYSEITAERPLLLSDTEYKKQGTLFFIGKGTIPDLEKSYLDRIEDLFEKCSLVRIIIPENEDVVVFQTMAKLGEGSYIVYTKYGNEYSDEYMQITEWLSETWYIAKT